LVALEELPEAIETFIQHQAVAEDPALDVREVLRSEAAPPGPPHLLGAYQVRVLQNLDVLLEAGERDPERLGELADGGSAATEALQDSPACGVRERREGWISAQAQRPRSSGYLCLYALRLSMTFST
jgi:hypothetical protein